MPAIISLEQKLKIKNKILELYNSNRLQFSILESKNDSSVLIILGNHKDVTISIKKLYTVCGLNISITGWCSPLTLYASWSDIEDDEFTRIFTDLISVADKNVLKTEKNILKYIEEIIDKELLSI